MLPRIHQLPESVVTRIAAGEVVERPASVLKELIENSIDAAANEIFITVEGAGRSRLIVSDNGHGMTREEALLSLRRHATSKISKFEDLESIATFGFRGEALPSIASVSRLRLTTRSESDESGWEIEVEGGKILFQKPVAREAGTTIEVRDIFFNTPARFKFLKSDTTERSQCVKTIEEIAFASLAITFHLQLERNKPIVFRAQDLEQKSSVLKTRLGEAWGSQWAKGVEAVAATAPRMSLWGVVTNQGHHQATSRSQILFVNRRPVQNRRLTRAVYDAYRGQLPSLRHPGWVLFLDVDPQTLDVNVHPAKREVKLTFESEIFGFLRHAVQTALFKKNDIPVEMFQTPMPQKGWPPGSQTYQRGMKVGAGAPPPLSRVGSAVDELVRPLSPQISDSSLWASPPSADDEFESIRQQKPRALAQVGGMYILAEVRDGIVIVDQHAAAEKVLYENLYQNYQSGAPQIQMLLVPFNWDVALSLVSPLKDNLKNAANVGFLIEPFGGNTFLVKGYPRVLGEKFDLLSLLDGLMEVFTETHHGRGGTETRFEHRLAAVTACKAAVKAHDPLEMKECQRLLEDLSCCTAQYTCPHGRPTVIKISFDELERKFRRS